MKMVSEKETFLLKPGKVHAWLFNLDNLPQAQPAWERLLSAEEIERSKHFLFDKDRLRFIARRGILRLLLSRYCGMDPAGFNYYTNPYGKLSLSSHPISFNLSKSQNRIAFAFTLNKEIGVDIEQVRPLADLPLLVERWFSQEERAGLAGMDPAVKVDAFYHIWTQKEAFIKAHGEGLSYSLKDFSVSVDPNKPGRLLSIKGGAEKTSIWKITNAIPEAGWRVAVCVRAGKDSEVTWYMPKWVDFVSSVTSGKTSHSV